MRSSAAMRRYITSRHGARRLCGAIASRPGHRRSSGTTRSLCCARSSAARPSFGTSRPSTTPAPNRRWKPVTGTISSLKNGLGILREGIVKSSIVIHQSLHNAHDRTQEFESRPTGSPNDGVSGPRAPYLAAFLSHAPFTATLAIPDLMHPIADDYHVDVKVPVTGF